MSKNAVNNPFQSILTSIMEINKGFLESFVGLGEGDAQAQNGQALHKWLQQCVVDDPQAWQRLIAKYQEEQLNFWANLVPENMQQDVSLFDPLSPIYDTRFKDPEWHENPVLNMLKQSYLLVSKNLENMVDTFPLPPAEKQKFKFYVKYFLDAFAPTNFFMTNPEVIRRALETGGESLLKGLDNLAKDTKLGRLSITDESAFALGKNLGITPGEVIYENEIMQLIQYRPTTALVSERPLLIVPPCINKFYILDLQPHNSFVKYCLDQGYQVFLLSWVNPDCRQSELGWDDYVKMGVLQGLEVVENIVGKKKINVLSWCIGGTLLATAMAVLESENKINKIASTTYLTTMLDFSDPGDMGVFVDEKYLESQEKAASETGFIPGQDLYYSFSMIRANDLIWSYFIKNYLQGIDPPPFDILYWNSDPTNQPLKLYSYFMRNMYNANKLIVPGALTICGVPFDLTRIKTPSYFLLTIDDHIVSWKKTFSASEIFSAPKEFVLGAGGHVAGVINPPGQNKKHYWINGEKGAGANHWLETSTRVDGSWWKHWNRWLKRRSGKKVAAPKKMGNDKYPVIEKAPGRYVQKRINFSSSLVPYSMTGFPEAVIEK